MIELGASSDADLVIHSVLLSVVLLGGLRAHVMEMLMELGLEIDLVNSSGDLLEAGLVQSLVILMAPRLALLWDTWLAPRSVIY